MAYTVHAKYDDGSEDALGAFDLAEAKDTARQCREAGAIVVFIVQN